MVAAAVANSSSVDSSSSEEDEWDAVGDDIEALSPPPRPPTEPSSSSAAIENSEKPSGDDDDDNWMAPAATTKEEKIDAAGDGCTIEDDGGGGEPMILVDLTCLSDSKVHNRNDANSVNDPELASTWRRKIEREYGTYSTDTGLLASGVVVPCGSSVWKDAVAQLRRSNKGHYYVPIFPPTKKK